MCLNVEAENVLEIGQAVIAAEAEIVAEERQQQRVGHRLCDDREIDAGDARTERQPAEAERQRQATEQARTRKGAATRVREDQREAAQANLQAQYNTPPQLNDEWCTVLEDIRLSGQSSLYTLLANSLALTVDDGVLTIAVPTPDQAQQLAHPKIIIRW